MTLASHKIEDARGVVQAFRAAAEKCTDFRDIELDFGYEDVEVQPNPGYGDESVSLRLVQVVPSDVPDGVPVKVPHAVVVARKGTVVAMFHSFNRPTGPDRKRPASIPDDLVRAQVDKIGDLGASE